MSKVTIRKVWITIRKVWITIRKICKLALYNTSYLLDFPIIKPRFLQISLTTRCNLRCKMCSLDKFQTSADKEMSLEEVINLIDIACRKFKVKELVLTGGEPLLLGDKIVKISEFAHRKKMRIVLTSNGFFFQEYAYHLAKAGVSHFHISIDGLKDTHNYLRGNPASFDKAVESIKLLAGIRSEHNYNYSIGIATLILKQNIKELYDLYRYGDALKVDIFDLLPYLPDNTNFRSTNETNFWPDHNDMKKFIEVYKAIIKSKANYIKINPSFDVGLVYKYYRKTISPKDWKCFAGFKNFFVTMSDPYLKGVFEPCLFLCKTYIPIREYGYDLEKIWYSLRAYKGRRAIRKCRVHCYQMCFSLPSLKKSPVPDN